MKKLAFTLAEVLITLGIIGVVAAMTIPNLIASNEKRTTLTRLKKTYSELMQVVRLAENEYGSGFSLCDAGTCDWEWVNNKAAFEKYFMPYMKIARIYEKSECNKLTTVYTVSGIKVEKPTLPCYQLMNGTSIAFGHSNKGNTTNVAFWVFPDTKPSRKSVMGRHLFFFTMFDEGAGSYALGTTVRLRDKGMAREKLIKHCKASENLATITIGGQSGVSVAAPCTELIMRDGWNFSGDYPIKFK